MQKNMHKNWPKMQIKNAEKYNLSIDILCPFDT